MLDISMIRDLINGVIDSHNINRDDLVDKGAIYYSNGNDGTKFDYDCNNMTCEFMVYWKDSGYGSIKLNQRGDKFDIFVYPKDNPMTMKPEEIETSSPFDLRELCEYLQGTFDDDDIYDESITNWKLDNQCFFYDDDEEEDEDWYYR